MILGMSLETYTLAHVLISLVGIGSGAWRLRGLCRGGPVPERLRRGGAGLPEDPGPERDGSEADRAAICRRAGRRSGAVVLGIVAAIRSRAERVRTAEPG